MADATNAAYEYWKRKKKAAKQVKKAARRDKKDMGLTITSLLDALTIILLFLLKSFGDNPVNITQKKGELQLPKSMSTSNMADMVDIHIGESAILVHGKSIHVNVKNGKVDENVKRDGADGFFITPLYKALKEKAKKLKTKAKRAGWRFEGNALVAADKAIPYRLLSEVLYTANQAEFKLYSFAIVKTRE
ncbi:MAG: biopolymer transporter ExbD [Deltaproteobacteria bacterium]|nr:biopolymer transporter ExbD [Deltaproteobacteria bacterium]